MICIGLAETTLGNHLKTAYNIGNIGNIKGRGENGIKPTDFRKGKKKNASQHVSQPEASAPATVQLQVDPERRGAFSLYQSRGFVVVPQPYTL